eukprot:gene8537-9410_t
MESPPSPPVQATDDSSSSFRGGESEESGEAQGVFVETFFGDGPLGVTLRRHGDNGIVFIFDVISDSQAVNLDVQPGDELWSVGSFEIGRIPLDKEAWRGLIAYIKESSRPLRMVWFRKTTYAPLPPPPPAPLDGPALGPPPDAPAVPLQPPAAPGAPGASPLSSPKNSAVPNESSSFSPVSSAAASRSAEYAELEKMVARLTFKEKEQNNLLLLSLPSLLPLQSTRRNTVDNVVPSILQEGRRIVRQGDLLLTSKSNKWGAKPAMKRVILLNDLLLITAAQPGNMFNLESLVDLPTCKVKSLGHAFGVENNAEDASFELLWPGGEIQLTAESKEVKDIWVLNLYLSICECVGEENQVLGWRHQYMLGTVHSAVLHRDEARIRELVGYCQAGLMDYLVLDQADEDGYTPLHYACMLRMHNIIQILHEATADVTAADRHGFTALHWAALQLDDITMEMLCSHVFDIDFLDRQGRSPLTLACLEGRNSQGKLDPHRLASCLKIMLTHNPNVHYVNSMGETLLHVLGGSWQHEALDAILEVNADLVNTMDVTYGMTPLHYAALGDLTKPCAGEASRVMNLLSMVPSADVEDENQPTGPDGVDTLRALLKAGARVNMKDNLGRTALTILLDASQIEKWGKDDAEAAVAILVSSGSRPDDTNVAVIKSALSDLNLPVLIEKWASLPVIDCNRLEIRLAQYDPSGSTAGAAGGEEVAGGAGSANVSVKSNPGDTNKAGSKCKLCGVTFTMFRRCHHCRLCNVACCDDCSKKRCFVDNAQVRTCDCCFNRVFTLEERRKTAELISNMRPLPSVVTATSLGAGGGSLSSSAAAEKEKKESLFGFSFAISSSAAASSSDSTARRLSVDSSKQSAQSTLSTQQASTNATMGLMSEAHEKLVERGEKLSRMSDKTEELASQASEFARLARQLNEQQKSRWF